VDGARRRMVEPLSNPKILKVVTGIGLARCHCAGSMQTRTNWRKP
jgi:hypothetical protein